MTDKPNDASALNLLGSRSLEQRREAGFWGAVAGFQYVGAFGVCGLGYYIFQTTHLGLLGAPCAAVTTLVLIAAMRGLIWRVSRPFATAGGYLEAGRLLNTFDVITLVIFYTTIADAKPHSWRVPTPLDRTWYDVLVIYGALAACAGASVLLFGRFRAANDRDAAENLALKDTDPASFDKQRFDAFWVALGLFKWTAATVALWVALCLQHGITSWSRGEQVAIVPPLATTASVLVAFMLFAVFAGLIWGLSRAFADMGHGTSASSKRLRFTCNWFAPTFVVLLLLVPRGLSGDQAGGAWLSSGQISDLLSGAIIITAGLLLYFGVPWLKAANEHQCWANIGMAAPAGAPPKEDGEKRGRHDAQP
jgi:hypothetical protein